MKVLKKIAECSSVTKAALALHMTQPAASNVIRLLEESLGTPVIEVLHKKTYLTLAGKILLEGIEQIHQVLEQTKMKIALAAGSVSGNLRVASVSTAKYFVPRLLGAFKEKNPQIHISLKVKNREEVIQRLKDNLDDFVIMSQLPNDFSIESQDFFEDVLVVAASSQHPLIKKNKIPLKKLAKEAWLIREVGSGTRIAMLKILKEHQIDPQIEMEIDNNESIKQAIIGNIGISILSKQSIVMELKSGLIQIIDVQEFPIRHEWYLVKNKKKILSPIAQKFYEFVRTRTPNFLG